MGITDELRERIDAVCRVSGWDCKRLTAIADRIDAALAERYVELPKDADGEYIHVGDVMEFSRFEIEYPVTREVDGIGQGVFFAWYGERGYEQLDAGSYRHRKQPTVEDVLRKFAEGLGVPVADSYIAASAAKLRLAGDAE